MGPEETTENTVELVFEIDWESSYFPRRVIHIDREKYLRDNFPTLHCLRIVMRSLKESPDALFCGLRPASGNHVGWDEVRILIQYPPHPALKYKEVSHGS